MQNPFSISTVKNQRESRTLIDHSTQCRLLGQCSLPQIDSTG